MAGASRCRGVVLMQGGMRSPRSSWWLGARPWLIGSIDLIVVTWDDRNGNTSSVVCFKMRNSKLPSGHPSSVTIGFGPSAGRRARTRWGMTSGSCQPALPCASIS